MVKNLIELGTSINSINTIGQTPLHIAAARGYLDMATFLLNEAPQKDKIDINLQDDLGQTPLHTAALKASSKDGNIDHLKICQMLLQQTAINATITTYESDNPLHLIAATPTSSKDPSFKAAHEAVVKVLLEKGVDAGNYKLNFET